MSRSQNIKPFEHQEWKEVKLKQRPSNNANNVNNTNKATQGTTSTQTKRFGAGKNIQKSHVNGFDIERKLEDENFSVKRIPHRLKLDIQRERQRKSWTQEQLANACNLPVNLIKNYENGTALPKREELCKIEKSLGVTFNK